VKQAFFITGTGTHVGKTLVTGLLAKYFIEKNHRVITQKWVQTGAEFCEDLHTHDRVMGQTIEHPARNAYCFKEPVSPHLAARLNNVEISKSKLVEDFLILKKEFDIVIGEGAGGVLVPYSEEGFLIDVALECDFGVIVVIKNELGAIHAAFSSIEALQARKANIIGLVFNAAGGTSALILDENIAFIQRKTQLPVLAVLPYEQDENILFEVFNTQLMKFFPLFSDKQ
jgi:dethiobiotin synthetase